MTIKNNKLKIAIFGPYPPPYGGVSIHIQRLVNLLLQDKINCKAYDITQFFAKTEKIKNPRVKKWPKILFFTKGIIHIHNSGFNLLKILLLSSLMIIFGNKIIITYHSLRDDIENFNWFKRKAVKIFIPQISHFIAVNSRIKGKLIDFGVKSEKITVIPGFLPPTIRKNDIEQIPFEIWDFINNHHPLISANAFRIEFYKNQDLYGIDMCIELCANLINNYPKIGFIFCLPVIGDDGYFKKMKNMIYSKNLENNFLFITQPYQFYPILQASDLFVRPTNTDGDAISLREALFFKKPSVVSNIIPRPKGANVFLNRDTHDFIITVEKILENYEKYKKELENLEVENNFSTIKNIYNNLLCES